MLPQKGCGSPSYSRLTCSDMLREREVKKIWPHDRRGYVRGDMEVMALTGLQPLFSRTSLDCFPGLMGAQMRAALCLMRKQGPKALSSPSIPSMRQPPLGCSLSTSGLLQACAFG